jgi:hypothetical protein
VSTISREGQGVGHHVCERNIRRQTRWERKTFEAMPDAVTWAVFERVMGFTCPQLMKSGFQNT